MRKIITINWEGPFSYDTAINEYHLDNEERCDFGLYQIYGPHDLYKNKKRAETENVLLYVGKTISGSAFSGRISRQGFCHGSEFEIYFGRIEGANYNDDKASWEQDVSDAEKILINKYAPSYNGTGVGDLRPDQLDNSDFIIKNIRLRADLDEEIASEDVVYRPEASG